MPRLHGGFEDLLSGVTAPVWMLPTAPDSPGTQALTASGWDRTHGSIEPLAARLRDLAADGYQVMLGAPHSTADRLSALLADHGARVEPLDARPRPGRGAE